MPEILVIRQPADEIHDRVRTDEDGLGETIEELYEKTTDKYSLEVLHDTSDRTSNTSL